MLTTQHLTSKPKIVEPFLLANIPHLSKDIASAIFFLQFAGLYAAEGLFWKKKQTAFYTFRIVKKSINVAFLLPLKAWKIILIASKK